jgi:hypothetical protein
MVKGKFERTKPHVNVGTIAHTLPRNHGRSYARSLLQMASVQAALASQQNTSSVTLYGNIGENTGSPTYTNMNEGPMGDYRTRDERRGKKKRKHGNQSGSKYKRRNWWE